MKRKTFVTIIICLISTMLLAGCGNTTGASDSTMSDKPENVDESAEKKDAENDSETVEEPEKKEENDEKAVPIGKSLAQRMAGKYSYQYSDEELYIMDVVPFGDNLYAFCGRAMADDSDSFEAYTFWTSEFIPYDADEVTSTDGDTTTVNELRFSIMSNAGKYWDAGCKGTVTLTDDGLIFEGFDDDFLTEDGGGSREFARDDRVEEAFSYTMGGKGSNELEGVWILDRMRADLYIRFDGSDMYIYCKDPGSEVFYAAGGCDCHDGSFDCMANFIDDGGQPFEFSCDYKVDGDTLTLKITDGDVPEQIPENGKYERIGDGRVHVTTMNEVELSSDSLGMSGGYLSYDTLREQDYYGVFVSSAKSPEGCTLTIDKLEEAGIFRSFAVYTPDFSELNPEPYYVVTTGLYTSESDAREALSEAKAAGFKGAYVKYAGSYTGDRYWYTMYGGEKIDVLSDGVMIRGVSLAIPYSTDGEPIDVDLLVTKDTIFDRSADFEAFGNYEKGDTPYEWIVRNYKLMNDDPDEYLMNGPPLSGIFEVGLDNNKITTYYGSYWWD